MSRVQSTPLDETAALQKDKVCSGNLKFEVGSIYIPKDNPTRPQGQDDHFVLPEFQALGVADGVGGWSNKGIDSGEYSRELMYNTANCIKQQKEGPVDPKKALQQAFGKTQAEGSSTACIVALHNHSLHSVNVGDSGFVHIRHGRIIYLSQVQQHRFNQPYQLGKETNDIDLAEEIKRDVVTGDIVVAGTDGLFDNVHKEELERLVRKGEENAETAEFLAWKCRD